MDLIYPLILTIFIIFCIFLIENLKVVDKNSTLSPSSSCPSYSVNIYNGEKRLVNGGPINQLYEACSSGNGCDLNTLPYALNADGSTNTNGLCESDVPCRCVNRERCSFGTTSIFQLPPGATTYKQRSTNQSNSLVDPFFYDSSFETCLINTYDITSIGTEPCVSGNLNWCIESNPCQSGILAFVGEGNNYLGCVTGVSCPVGTAPKWDSKSFSLTCI